MKTKKAINIVFLVSISFVIFTFILTFIASFISYSDMDQAKKYQDFSKGWLNEEGEEVKLDKLFESCKVHKTIPEMEFDSMLSFNARNLDVDVYIDDQCVYRVKKTDDPFLKALYGKTKGSDFVEVNIPKEYDGKTIYIDIHNPYSNGAACKIVHMFFGDASEIVKHDSSTQLASFCFSFIILFLGVVCILLYIPMKKNNMVDTSVLYLGIAALTFGMSMITDCKLLHLIVGHEALYYIVSQLFMHLLLVPLLLFFMKLYSHINKKVVIAICIASLADFVIIFILTCLDISDYHDNAFAMLLITGGSILYITAVTIKEFIKNGNENIFHNIGVIMIGVSVILDMIMERSDVFVETSFFTRFGIAGFTLMECTQVLWKHLENYQDGLKAQLVSRLAYHDGLTDLLNRTSYIEDVDKLETEDNSDTLVAVFDVNNLKYVNDTYGHSGGDELIITAANAIKDAFEEFGKCYRIGGDEFVFITKCIGAENKFLKCQKQMMKNLERLDQEKEYPISVASGYAVMSEKHSCIKDLINCADERMYENKKLMKENIKLPETAPAAETE